MTHFEHNAPIARSARVGRAIIVASAVENQAAAGRSSARDVETPEDPLAVAAAVNRGRQLEDSSGTGSAATARGAVYVPARIEHNPPGRPEAILAGVLEGVENVLSPSRVPGAEFVDRSPRCRISRKRTLECCRPRSLERSRNCRA